MFSGRYIVPGKFIATNRGDDQYIVTIEDCEGEYPKEGKKVKERASKPPAQNIPEKDTKVFVDEAEKISPADSKTIAEYGGSFSGKRVAQSANKTLRSLHLKVGDFKPKREGEIAEVKKRFDYDKYGCGCGKIPGINMCKKHGRI